MSTTDLPRTARAAALAGESVTNIVLDHFGNPDAAASGIFDLLNFDEGAIDNVTVLARPGETLKTDLRPGDILLSRVRGEKDAGRVGVVANGQLAELAEVRARGLQTFGAGPGVFAEMIVDGPRGASEAAVRVADRGGRVPLDRMLVRPEAAAGARDASAIRPTWEVAEVRPTWEVADVHPTWETTAATATWESETEAERWQGERWPSDSEQEWNEAGSVLDICRPGEGPAGPEPDPTGRAPHPLVLRGTSQARSRRPTVGYAQQCLNEFIARYQAGTYSCPSSDLAARVFVDSVLARLRSNSQLPLQVDCRFGSNTELATKAFQTCAGVSPDGRIGPITWPLLEAFAPVAPVPPPVPPTPPLPPVASLSGLEGRYFPPPGTTDAAPFSRAATATPIIDGRDYFGAIKASADALRAGDAWYLAGWWTDPDFRFPDGTKLGDLLVERASAGVDVRVIVWANRQVLDNPRLAGVLGAGPYMRVIRDNINAAENLRGRSDASGRPVLAGRVLIDWSGNAASSHHMKFNVFARESTLTGYVGGIDFQQNRLDVPMHRPGPSFWHDAGVRVEGHAAARALETFVTRWTEASTLSSATYDLGAGARQYNPAPIAPLTPPSGTAIAPSPVTSVQVVRSIPDSKEFGLIRNTPWQTLPSTGVHEAKRTFQTALGAAQRYIYIEDQSFDAVDSLFPSLVSACKRGVKVIALIPGIGDPLDTPGKIPAVLSSAVVSGLLSRLRPSEQENLAVWQLDGIVVHSKLVLIDDEYMSIGSANFMDRSMQFTFQGDDSELSVSAVSSGSLVSDLRVNLWAEHLRVTGPAALAEIRDLSKSLGFWRANWGSGVTFAHPDTRLIFVGPRPGTGPGPGGGGRSSLS